MTERSNNDHGTLGGRGVELVTAFIDKGDDASLMYEVLEKIAVEEEGLGLAQSAMGLVYLSTRLLALLAQATGTSEQQLLQEMGQYFATH